MYPRGTVPTRLARVTFLAIGLLVLSSHGLARAAQLHPTPAQQSTCLMPPSLRTVRGHALFRYQVDTIGRVGSIEDLYATADPESRQGEFVSVLKKCLSAWRYDTADPHLMALPTRMLMAFHFFAPAPEGAATIEVSAERKIPLAHFDEMRREKMRFAEKLLAGKDYSEVRNDGYSVLTNVPGGPKNELIEAIDRAHRAFSELFPAAPAAPAVSGLTLFFFKDEGSFNQVAAFDNLFRMQGGIAGQYSPPERTAYASLGDKPSRIVIAELAHEAAHHLVHQRLFQGEQRYPPYWVNEGIASFIEMLRPAKKLDFKRFARGRQQQGHSQWASRGDSYLEAVSAWEGAGPGARPDFSAFLSESPDIWPLPSDLSYGLSWLTVHLLINGEGEAYRERFQKWLLTEADRQRGASIVTALGLTPDEFRRKVSEHRRRLEKNDY